MRRKSWYLLWLYLGALTLTGPVALAQTDSSNTRKSYDRYWISAGFGRVISQFHPPGLPAIIPVNYVPQTGKTAQFFGLMGTAHFQPRHTRSVISLRYVLNGELMYHNLPGIRYEELGVLYGLRFNNVLISTGISKSHGVDRGQFIRSSDPGGLFTSYYFEKITYQNFGLPLEVRFILPFQGFSFGLAAFGNINDGHSYGGLNLSICLGRMN